MPSLSRVMETADTFTLQQFLGVLRRRGWIVVQLAVIVAVAGVALGLRASREYEASASVLVGSQQALPIGGQQAQSSAALSAPTAAKLVATRSVADRVRRELGTDRSIDDLLARITTSSDLSTQLVRITARGSSGGEAAQIANAFAHQFVATRAAATAARLRLASAAVARAIAQNPSTGATHDALMGELTQLQTLAAVPPADAQIADVAVAPAGAASPHLVRNGVLGFGLGALLGLLAIFTVEAMDPRVKDSQELQRLVPAPQLASVPATIFQRGLSPRKRRQPRVLAAAHSHFEPFERLRTSLLVFNGERELRTVLVTSPSDEREGKTTVAANLAISLAKIGLKVCIVDADLRKPRLARHFGLYAETGLTDLLQGAPLKKVLQKFEVPGGPVFNGNGNGNGNGHGAAHGPEISVLCAGKATDHPAELLASKAMRDALDELERTHDIVLVDCSPLLAASDTMSLLGHACGTLLVVRLFHTPRKAVVRAVRVIERARGGLLGVVGTGVPARELREEGFGPWPAESSEPARVS
jgi:Mrp family chromosome partitioning ATPase/capsular polysaccharide biosynthesis protein